ncbi:MAG: glycosyltransferase family 2 protein [Flavipsychrobacter sp.]|nr:glycosyltransferase family 2 protein [Flavipsychrobacter sp.]
MIATILTDLWIVLQIIVGYNLFVPLFLYLLYVVFKRKPKANKGTAGPERDYAIIVTAYEQTDSLPAVVDSILKLKYSNYLVYIVADKCDISSLKFADKRVVVLRPPETLASNTRSHFYAINNFQRAHELLIIIDSDNLIEPDCLNELNKDFDRGYSAVQGLREAKNLDTTYACLDASRDIYYHFYDGEVLFGLGSSATLSGSGMAFKTSLYKECLEHLDITGAGFDKVLQKEIVSRGMRIAFNEHAVVYDEKTSRSDQLVKQRARWINTWFKYFKFGFSLVAQGVAKFDLNRFLFGIILLRPPLFIFLILSVFCLVADIWLSTTGALIWGAGFISFILGFIIALVHARPDKRIVRSLVSIPKFVFFQVLSLLQVKKANKVSVATQHYSKKSINDIDNEA